MRSLRIMVQTKHFRMVMMGDDRNDLHKNAAP